MATGWLERWLASCADLADLHAHNPLLDAVVQEVDGRRIRIGDHWLIDFASCNYLGLDLDRQVIAAIPAYLRRWGTHPSWSRMLGSPVLYEQIETRLTELLGAPDTLLLQVNEERGEALRAGLYRKTRRVLDKLAELGATTLNTSGWLSCSVVGH
jgi:hypothetical protein